MPRWIRVIDATSKALASVAVIALVLLTFQVFLDVVGRTIFNKPIAGTLEHVAKWWMPCLVFLALGAAERSGEHLRATFLVGKLSPVRRRQVDFWTCVACGVLMAYVGHYVVVGAAHATQIRETVPGGAEVIVIWPFTWVAVVGIAGLLLQTGATGYRLLADDPSMRRSEDEGIVESATS